MLIAQIQDDLKNALIARDEVKVSTLRLLLSEIHNAEIAKGEEIGDEDVTLVIQREVKKRKEAAAGFRQGEREESAQKEELEAKVLEGYLPARDASQRDAGGPAALPNEELTKLVEKVINEVGATNMADIGKVMG